MNRKINIVFIAIMLVAAVFLSGCVDSNSVNASSQSSDGITEKVNPATENDNNTKMMSVQEDIVTNKTNEINGTTNAYSLNTTTNDTTSAYSLNTTNTTSIKTTYSSSSGSSSKSHSSSSSSSDSDSSSDETIVLSSDSNETDTVQIIDMLGRNLTIPGNISSVIATSPPSTILVYMLAPDEVAGWNFINSFNHTLMNEKYLNLPVIGGWYGTTTGNYETMISMNPDIVIEGYNTQGDVNDTIVIRQENFGSIPVVAINGSIVFVKKSNPTIEYVGKLLDCEEQADKLINFRSQILNEVNEKINDIPEDERVHVYYAEGSTGLMTDPSGSQHSQVINICGGINVANCTLTPGNGMTPVSMEDVIGWNPEVILTADTQFYNSVYSDSLWANIDAVKNKRVYLAPQNPFCWIDRPQGPHLIIGTAWTAKMLYPDQFADMDLDNLTREFYSDFFHYDLTDEELNSLLYPESEA
ncbi:iron ABC transporter substrate-binding protein [uncultured Methanomethylovorans sp.]|uniref:iron ABC transporter substrate-binding protein n=1 Tax=uncultured Methanomethylovorans sp. TaxID=183759 RepID=UPI002AA5EFF9|nr:iron ABC transporter substrate-binding protein [uncultured Methanomethylovorans sp.]